ncbi:hypothetical protein MMC12_007500 [Toensbergia leucococca]|nr:hypothetical protein [Toensbergia leucococca]
MESNAPLVDAPNSDFSTDFELDTSAGNTLRIHNDSEVNREKITADRIHNTLFSCLLRTVQYGTYEKEPAVLLVFAFHFGYHDEARDRYTTAAIEFEFEETSDAKLRTPDPRNKNNDPKVKFIAPVRVTGTPSKEKNSLKWILEGSLTYQIPLGPAAGLTPSVENEKSSERNRRMWLNGEMDSDDDHRYHNRALWTTGENPVEKSGILHNFPAAVVVTLPKDPEHFVKVKLMVTPYVAFSINPIRLFPKRDDPIFLDRATPKGPQYAAGKDFSDADFPWATVVKIPTEYEVHHAFVKFN